MENFHLIWQVFKVWLYYRLEFEIFNTVLGIRGFFFPYSMIFEIVDTLFFCSECYYSIVVIKNQKRMLSLIELLMQNYFL